VLVMDDMLVTPMINKLEQKFETRRFVRVDSDVVEHLIKKDDTLDTELSWEEKQEISPMFQALTPENGVNYIVDFKNLGENGSPMVITRSEWMRRMKDMSQFQGGMNFYGDLPESLNLVVNTAHPLVKKVLKQKDKELGEALKSLGADLEARKAEVKGLEEAKKDKKEEEVASADSEKLEVLNKEVAGLEEQKRNQLKEFGRNNKLAKQMVDLALLANGLLRGADLDRFVKRSVELIK
jgi:molecular chaperone HtpG